MRTFLQPMIAVLMHRSWSRLAGHAVLLLTLWLVGNGAQCHAETFDEWRLAQVGIGQFPTDNFDGDYYNDFMEYALGSSPETGATVLSLQPTRPAGMYIVRLNGTVNPGSTMADAMLWRPKGRTHLTYQLQRSLDTKNWFDVSGPVPLVVQSQPDADLLRYPGISNTGAGSYVSWRLKISDPGGRVGYTYPVSIQRCSFAGTQSFGYQLADRAQYVGFVDTVTPDGLSVAETDIVDFQAILDPGQSYYVEFADGPLEGHRVGIDLSNSTQHSLSFNFGAPVTNISAVPPTVARSRFVLRRLRYIDEVIHPSIFSGSFNSSTSDRLMLWRGTGYQVFWKIAGVVGAQTMRYWTDLADVTLADAGKTPLIPGMGLFVKKYANTAAILDLGEPNAWKQVRRQGEGTQFLSGNPSTTMSAVEFTQANGCVALADDPWGDKIETWNSDGGGGTPNQFTTRVFKLVPTTPVVARWCNPLYNWDESSSVIARAGRAYFFTGRPGGGFSYSAAPPSFAQSVGVNPFADVDQDGLRDQWELGYFGSIEAQSGNGDADSDGVSNLVEHQYRTSPLVADTDGDWMPDQWEITNGLDPLNLPQTSSTLLPHGDFDQDGANNWQEYLAGSNPQSGVEATGFAGHLTWSPVAWLQRFNASVQADYVWKTLVKATETIAEDAGADSVAELLSDGSLRFQVTKGSTPPSTPTGTHLVAGLSLPNSATASADVLYGFEISDNLSLKLIGFGTGPETVVTLSYGDVLTLHRNAGVMSCYRNGQALATTQTADSRHFILDVTMRTNAVSLSRAETAGFVLDLDGDGLADAWENLHFPGAELIAVSPLGNEDGDTLTNAQEYALGTDPTSWDTDGDGTPDGVENSAANLADGDHDGIPYGVEAYWGLDDSDATDAWADLDHDGLSNLVEYRAGYSLNNPAETLDSDNDGMSDHFESHYGLRFDYFHDAARDDDGDGVFNFEEALFALDPTNPHTRSSQPEDAALVLPALLNNVSGAITDPITGSDWDGDGLSDTYEHFVNRSVAAAASPPQGPLSAPLPLPKQLRSADAQVDTDGDGLSDFAEFQGGLNPTNPDTDGDGLADGLDSSPGIFPIPTSLPYAPLTLTPEDRYLRGLGVEVRAFEATPVPWTYQIRAATRSISQPAGELSGPASNTEVPGWEITYPSSEAGGSATTWVRDGYVSKWNLVMDLQDRINEHYTVAAGTVRGWQTLQNDYSGWSYYEPDLRQAMDPAGTGVIGSTRRDLLIVAWPPDAITPGIPPKVPVWYAGYTGAATYLYGDQPGLNPQVLSQGLSWVPLPDYGLSGSLRLPHQIVFHERPQNAEPTAVPAQTSSISWIPPMGTPPRLFAQVGVPQEGFLGVLPGAVFPQQFKSNSVGGRPDLEPVITLEQSGAGRVRLYAYHPGNAVRSSQTWDIPIGIAGVTAPNLWPVLYSANSTVLQSPDTKYFFVLEVPGDVHLQFKIQQGPFLLEESADFSYVSADIVPDFNRDGVIDSSDKGNVTEANPWRWWINDDDDSNPTGGIANDDIPGKPANPSDHGQHVFTADSNNGNVDGICDLPDFFPLHLEIQALISHFPPSSHMYSIRNADNAINYLETDLTTENAGAFLTDPETVVALKYAQLVSLVDGSTTQPTAQLSTGFLANLHSDPTKGVLLVECSRATSQDIVLEISDSTGVVRQRVTFAIAVKPSDSQVASIEHMYRWVNLRGIPNLDPGANNAKLGPVARKTEITEPTNRPDHLTTDKHFVFVHGFRVPEADSRGWGAEVFKRMYQMGMNAKFTMVSWHGNTTSPVPWESVTNAFMSAPRLKEEVDLLPGTKVIAGHSMGNMLISSAIVDHSMTVDKYFMLDAAVPLEAYEPDASNLPDPDTMTNPKTQREMMRNPEWEDYGSENLRPYFASEWSSQFNNTTDLRKQLTWKNRFGNIPNAINFYSSGEEVLNNSTGEWTAWQAFIWPALGSGTFADRSWPYSEISKGRSDSIAGTLSTAQAGWGFNSFYQTFIVDGDDITITNLTPAELQGLPLANTAAQPFFPRFQITALHDPVESQVVLGQNLWARAKTLAEGIPATSFATGRNPIPGESWAERNVDLMGLKVGGVTGPWPSVRPAIDSAGQNRRWFHSDAKDVALIFNYRLFKEQWIELGNLK